MTPTRIITGAVLALTVVSAGPAHAKNRLTCGLVPRLMGQFLELHVAYRGPDTKLRDRIVTQYIDRIDPSKSILLASEAEAMRTRLIAVLDAVGDGKCDGLMEIHTEQIARQRENRAFVRKLLANKSFAVDRSIELNLDRDSRQRPKTVAERDELRRKLIHFQMAGYLRSGTKMAEAKKKLLHRYEIGSKRLRELKEPELLSDLLDTFAISLDPHSSYLSADQLEDFRIAMQLSLEGIGAVLSSEDGYTVVQEIVTGGAADRNGGLVAKDKIVAVAQGKGDSVDVVDMGLREVVRLIRGKKGTAVRLTVLRKSETVERHEVTIIRDKIDLKEQAAKLTWKTIESDGEKVKLAVLDLPSFYGGGKSGRNCTDDVRRLLEEARAGKAEGLLLDLSRNSGGLLQAAVEITGFFVKTGAVVGVDGPRSDKELLEDEDARVQYTGPLVVLTSRASASASEIVAGAIKDYRRGVIVGDDHTFGKGSVQHVVNLRPGFGALKVTMAMFYRPGGESTQSMGVPVDMRVPSGLRVENLGEKFQTYALPPTKIDAFLSAGVNGTGGLDHWTPVASTVIAALAKRSGQRIAKDKDFIELAENIEKADTRGEVVRISELFEDEEKKNDKKKDAEKKNKDKDDKAFVRPNVRESLNVLADLVARTNHR